MQIVGALDVHRRQITFKTLELASGESSRGRISPAAREPLRQWLERFAGQQGEFVLEGTTGWRFVVEEIERAGHVVRLADPTETAARRGRKRRAKTDDADCELQLRLLLAGELPEAWIPPAQILELRTRVRLRKTLIDQRTAWLQRLQAQLFHQGVQQGLKPRTLAGQQELTTLELSPAGREVIELCTRMLDQLDAELTPIDRAALRRRRGDSDGDPRRTGRCAPLQKLGRRCPPLRPRRHRLAIRPQARQRPPLPPRSGTVALGAVRGRPVRRPPR